MEGRGREVKGEREIVKELRGEEGRGREGMGEEGRVIV